MARSELLKRLADDHPGLPSASLRRIVDTIFSELTEGLAEGRRVELRDFGAFSAKHREPRKARKPKTGAAMLTSGSARVHFRTGKGLLHRLNPGLAERD